MRIFLCCLGLGFLSFGAIAQQKMSKAQFDGLSKNQQELYLRVKKADDEATKRMRDYLTVHGLENKVVKENGTSFILTDVVDGTPLYTTVDNDDAAIATGTVHLQVGGSLGLDLDGAGITVGVWDDGPVQTDHVELQNGSNTGTRVINVELQNTDGELGEIPHATHVSGTIISKGVNPNAKGMATEADVRTFNFLNDTPEMVSTVTNATIEMFLSNHSYGLPINQSNGTQLAAWRMGAYDQNARTVDDIASSNPQYLIVASAGNGGTDSYPGGLVPGFDKLTGNKNAKNNLVIANASPSIDPFTGDVTFTINGSSSQGPTDDLRIKPDISGDGTGLLSPVPGGGYSTFSGTSMSAPNVTGSLVLLQQYYKQLYSEYMMAATLKGLVCHTATDDAGVSGPDPRFGWGLLNTKKAAEVLTGSNSNMAVVDELTLDNNGTYTISFGAQAGDQLSATICWTDIPGLTASGPDDLNNPLSRLVNDLDVRISKDNAIFLPWKLNYTGSSFSNSKADNTVDNVERIDIDVTETGVYTLVVSHKGTLQSQGAFGPREQNFSLIVTGNNLTLGTEDSQITNNLVVFPNPSKGEFTISFDSSPNYNDDIKIDVVDMSGRLVYKRSFSNTSSQFSNTINLGDVASGIYLANISNGGIRSSHKIIID